MAVIATLGVATAGASAAQAATGTVGYRLTFGQSDKCLDDPGYSTANDTWLDQWTCGHGTNEVWYLDYINSTTFRIRNSYSGKCVNIAASKYVNNTHIVQYTCSNVANENFVMGHTSAGGYSWIESAGHTSYVLNIDHALTTNGAHVLLYSRSASINEYVALDTVGNGCPDYYLIGLRGSDEAMSGPFLMGSTTGPFATYVVGDVPVDSIATYSLPYPAVPVPSASNLSVYFDSVNAGAQDLVNEVQSEIEYCPAVRIGVIGYSQGAEAVNQGLNSMTSLQLANVRAALLIADPISAGAGTSYHVQTTFNGSGPGTGSIGGILGNDVLPTSIQSRAFDFCIVGDQVCDFTATESLFDAVGLLYHTGYPSCCGTTNWPAVLASAFATKLKA